MPQATSSIIPAAVDGQRLDNYLCKHLKGVPKTRIYSMIRSGEVRLDSKRVRAHTRIYPGAKLRLPPLRLPAPSETKSLNATSAAKLRERVLYADADLLIINKPANWAVHGGTGVTLGLIEALRQIFPGELNLAHRLDRETSGCLLLARTIPALRALNADFANHQVSKSYLAVVHGAWPTSLKVMEHKLRIERCDGERRALVSQHGRTARTEFRVLSRSEQHSCLQVEPISGRMHQIRAHCAHAGHPIVGDSKYATKTETNKPASELMLHCQHLRIKQPSSGASIAVSAPIPEGFMPFLNNQQERN